MFRRALVVFSTFALLSTAGANEYPLREDGADIFGQVERIRTRYEDTLIQIARRYSLGYEELLRVNQGIDPWLPGEDAVVLIPGQRLLPPGEREGIVVNLPEHRLYYFPKPKKKGEVPTVLTYPVSVGKMDWRTPIGSTKIVSKQKNPSWTPPKSVHEERRRLGEPPLPSVVPPGRDNPLGAHAMRLAIPGGAYLIHGTNNPDAVGMAVTHGCLRMYPEDIAMLFERVPVGTKVTLIDEPVKMTKIDGEVWLEVHPPIDDQGRSTTVALEAFEARLDSLLGESEVMINWDIALETLREARGIPVVIGLELLPEAEPQNDLSEPPADEPPADVTPEVESNESDVVPAVNR
ncbi:MAG: L,D-transpeptidase family protein [Steroidobacteraceae bacterium]